MVDDGEVNFRERSLIVSRVSGRSAWLAFACLSIFMGFIAIVGPSAAQAEDTVWICKPGQSDDLCGGTIDGSTLPPTGQSAEPLGYTRATNSPIDCFYLYPTQSEQPTANSNLDKDPPIRRVVVQQARMFSSVCKVYAPMYRQVTYDGNQLAHNPDVDVAYESAKAGFQDFLANYSKGRPFVMLGHSQGSAHTARLIDELVDTNANLRKRFLGAIAPGANVYVPKNEFVGGMYENVPACSEAGQSGCLVAYSMYKGEPGAGSQFSRLDAGYWIYPEARPDANQFEVVCTNPAELDGSGGVLNPLVNMDYLTGVPVAETSAPWVSFPDYYSVSCQRAGSAHWLNVSRIDETDTRPDLGSLVASGNNYHVPEVNLAEGNLLTIAQSWKDAYTAEQNRIKRLQQKLKNLNGNLAKSKKRLAASQKQATKLTRKAKKAKGKQKKALTRKATKARKSAAAERRRISSLKKQIAQVKKQIG
ncbi:MAG: hypothetical protein QG596_221 [Actinomycetota bacterium]|jgi:hypothetical protein|nr:hypothetical protein [Actinomycetota bacterium]